ncbi:hypothetical protein [Tunturiibacter gelidiferens]|uniref:hypothetical protein n=1 Tax=Tunturiibacter gelidiferens TaxID=3069689 RepID=UPI003D9B8F4D
MLIRILHTFSDENVSLRPILVNELLDVPDTIGLRWISEGRAKTYLLNSVTSIPPKRKREKASRL